MFMEKPFKFQHNFQRLQDQHKTQKFQNLQIQENQKKMLDDLKIITTSISETSIVNQIELMDLINKLALLFEQSKKLVKKHAWSITIPLFKNFFLQTPYDKVFKKPNVSIPIIWNHEFSE